MKFCKKCNNMLYIQSDIKTEGEEKVIGLKYSCRNCNYKEKDENPKRCVYENIYNQNSLTYDIIYNKYTRHDPTLPRMNTIKCINDKCISNQDIVEEVLILTDLSFHDGFTDIHSKIKDIVRSVVPDAEIIQLDDDTVIIKCPKNIQELRKQLSKIHNWVEYHKKIEPQIIFIKYDPEELKYVYICDYCNTSWKK